MRLGYIFFALICSVLSDEHHPKFNNKKEPQDVVTEGDTIDLHLIFEKSSLKNQV